MRALFVSNGHGEEAIAARIAAELGELEPEIGSDHLALVGEFGHPSAMRDVGPRRKMPSGGLIAMGNARNIARDIGAGLIGLTLDQRRFLRSVGADYGVAVAVGDVFALLMSLQTRVPVAYVGTAKSVLVAPYGPMERRVLRRARAVFVRDRPTAERLRAQGIRTATAANVIVDLHLQRDERVERAGGDFTPMLGLFPGSRAPAAYGDARFLGDVVRRLASDRPRLGGVLSIAPGLEPSHFAERFASDGWSVVEQREPLTPFALRSGDRDVVRAWCGGIGSVIAGATLVLGQAGTANEAAAAAGVPIVAFEDANARGWYRRRQAGLLGEALLLAPAEPHAAAACVRDLLDDAPRRVCMGSAGRERMGASGGARVIAARVAELARASS